MPRWLETRVCLASLPCLPARTQVDRKGKAVEPFMEYFAVRRSSESSSESSDGTGGTVANMLLNGEIVFFCFL